MQVQTHFAKNQMPDKRDLYCNCDLYCNMICTVTECDLYCNMICTVT